MIALGALFGAFLLRSTLLKESSLTTVEQSDLHTADGYIQAGNKRIPVSIADTSQARQRGLSGTASLPSGTGKLFVFDKADIYTFWMKDMRYPIDIVWIDESWKVVDVTEAVSPETYPATFSPNTPARYVLEVNAKEAVVDNLVIGTQLRLEK